MKPWHRGTFRRAGGDMVWRPEDPLVNPTCPDQCKRRAGRGGLRYHPITVTHFRTCSLCEAMCGLAIEVDGDRILSIRGDDEDVFSHGHICPKAVALKDLHEDPDRLRRPLRRRGADWEEIGWDAAPDPPAGRRLPRPPAARPPP